MSLKSQRPKYIKGRAALCVWPGFLSMARRVKSSHTGLVQRSKIGGICGSVFFRYPNSAFVLRLLDDLLGNLAGDRIVMRELHVETAARSSDRIQRRLIVEHFGHGYLRFDYLLLAACVHA